MDRQRTLPRGPEAPLHKQDTSVSEIILATSPSRHRTFMPSVWLNSANMSVGSGPGLVLGPGGPKVKGMWFLPSGKAEVIRPWSRAGPVQRR